MMEFKKLIKHRVGRFPMRKMPDAFQLDDVILRGKKRAKSFDQMFARNFIFEPVDHPKRLAHRAERADPALAVSGAFGHVAN